MDQQRSAALKHLTISNIQTINQLVDILHSNMESNSRAPANEMNRKEK